MTYNLALAERLRNQMVKLNAVEKKMFGGIGFLIDGNMVCGVHGDNLIVRVGPDRYEEILTHPLAKPFDMTGRPMTGWIEVLPTGSSREVDLGGWIRAGLDYVVTLPPKK